MLIRATHRLAAVEVPGTREPRGFRDLRGVVHGSQ